MRIEGREYTERNQRGSKESGDRVERECRDRWRVRTKRAGKIVSRVFLCFYT